MKIIFSFILTIFFLGNSCSSAERIAYDKQISLPREIFNFHVVTPNIMRGSQPSEKGFRLLNSYCGIKTILSLRNNQQHNDWEKIIVEQLGMNFINIPMHGNEEQSPEIIEQCLDIINDKFNQPIFVHCQAGKDRTGMILAAYRIKYDNWSFDDALMEMIVYGYDRDCCRKLEESLIKWFESRQNYHEDNF